jgi:thiol-disulfide isomerase/thioredoxin
MTEMPPQSSRGRRTWWVVGLGLALAWIVYLVLWGPEGSTGDLLPPRLERRPLGGGADYAWTLVGLDGTPVEFSRYRGRAVFLNLWATWCPPCVAELPAIAHLAANPALRDVAFVCVSIDDDLKSVRRFVRERALTLPVVWDAGAPPAVFQTSGIPATFLIAPDGQIVVAEVGSARWDDPTVVDFLKTLTQTAPAGGQSTASTAGPTGPSPDGHTSVTRR